MARHATLKVRIERAATRFVGEGISFTAVQKCWIDPDVRYIETLFHGRNLCIRLEKDTEVGASWNFSERPMGFMPMKDKPIHLMKRFVKSQISKLCAEGAISVRGAITDFNREEFDWAYHTFVDLMCDWDKDIGPKVYLPFIGSHIGLIMEDLGNAGSD